MLINRKGSQRIVIELQTVVIKVPNFLGSWINFVGGILANLREYTTWAYNSGPYEKGLSKYLCPVIWASWGGWILIMKKARPMTFDEYDNCQELEPHFTHFKGDDSCYNYGFIDNRPVKIDYGSLN